jgi:hypothetical protein
VKSTHSRLFGLLAVFVLLSCDSSTPPDWNEFTEDSVEGSLELLDEADETYLRVRDAQGAPAAAESTVALLAAQEAVAAARIAPDSSVTAFFANGLVGVVYEPELGTRDSVFGRARVEELVRAAGGGEVIASAVVLTPFAHDWGTAAEYWAAGLLDTCFGGPSPATERVSDGDVSVDKVKDVLTAGPGVLLWSSHGALVFRDTVDWDIWNVLLTGEAYGSGQMARRIVSNYAGGARAGGAARELVVVAIGRKHYLAITPTFVTSYGNFDYFEGTNNNGCKSIVYACCCHSGLTGGGLADAFLAAGADVYLGWSREVKALFAAQRQVLYFFGAADTCTAVQAYYGIGNVTDPWRGAQLLCYARDTVMVRAQMKFGLDSRSLHGYSVGVAVDDETSVACFASDPMQLPEFGVTASFPGAGPGSWNCVSDDDAVISVIEFATGKWYIVQKDFVGVNGTIQVDRYDDYVISGRFSGRLGHWESTQNPEEDPPSETREVTNGIFKHAGLRQ